ncbi:SprT family protein [Staphylococcus devriesei]|uniref:Protein SprT-like n=1 Tax=Staphylococcus devriesei TaxID=586733 RepID=A0A2K4DTZ5_9STAP|nr:SprT family protein [Staphylococcus devriesei]MCE5091028.1 SprT family protein [Staphylococcus devriesei]MCE5098051.1 SprT family protein [Staphylococcus devriesei]PNZ90296.1 SprT family protein [Staphylococcus devriesei]PTE71270.1 SprT family protein [Staphylococcus devriesei]PTF04313.1 SprT family protein [Staphylococcus devriesei]
MNNLELQQLVEEVSVEEFARAFEHKALFNKRLRTTGGRYLLDSHNIEINPKQYETYGNDALVDIIKHELCHYHLHLLGKGYKHRDRDFKTLSKQVNAPRFCTPIDSYEQRANYIYQCIKCNNEYLRIRKVNIKKMRCGYCGGKLKLKKSMK